MTARAPGASRLLVRDLAQLATPAVGEAPIRGRTLREVQVVGDAFVLCDGTRIAAAGPMRELARLELDGEV